MTLERESTTVEHVASSLITFIEHARRNGFQVGARETLDTMRLARAGLLWNRQDAYRYLRSIVCQRRSEWERFPSVFENFWRRHLESGAGGESARRAEAGGSRGGSPGISGSRGSQGDETLTEFTLSGDAHGDVGGGGAGDYEVFAQRDFRFVWDDSEMRAIEACVDRLAQRLQVRLSRRYRRCRVGGQVDFRNTIRSSLSSGGWPISLRFRRRRRDTPGLVLLVDVSQSMEIYTYLFLRFARALACVFPRFDAFAFHTRLVHIRDALTAPNTERLHEELSAISTGWHGGTRISVSLAQFNRDYSTETLDAHTIAIIVSDGYDTAAPDALGRELAAIARRARRVIWLNPLLGRVGGRVTFPVDLALKHALRHVDVYAPAHNLDSLRRLERYLTRA